MKTRSTRFERRSKAQLVLGTLTKILGQGSAGYYQKVSDGEIKLDCYFEVQVTVKSRGTKVYCKVVFLTPDHLPMRINRAARRVKFRHLTQATPNE